MTARPEPDRAQSPREIARQLARLLADLAPAPDAGARPSLLASLETALEQLDLAHQRGETCAEVAALRPALLALGVAGTAPASGLPLVLDGDLLFLRRHHDAEQRLAAALASRLLRLPLPLPPESLAALRALLPPGGAIDLQAVAAAAALRSRLCVIAGGPGTGKTTTVQKLLAVLLAGQPQLRIALAAPTGKAAARLAEAVALPCSPDAATTATAATALTLHRLLGYQAVEDAFRHGPDRPLPYDVVVVDEASLVDLELLDALLQALPIDARLVLLGDRDQLGAVGPGQVLADLCGLARPENGAGMGLAAFSREHLGLDLQRQQGGTVLADAVVVLTRNHRFHAQPNLASFAAALARRDAEAALQALRAGGPDLGLLAAADLDAALGSVLPALEAPITAADPAAALAALSRARVLCATRYGPLGVAAVNARVEALLRGRGHRLDGAFYRGRPLLITANDHGDRLYNGDLGIAWPDDEGRPLAWFPGRDGAPRPVQPQRLPAHETAFALTVHKSQGSEFDEVLVLLPGRDGSLLHAPLLYTAVTRARRRAAIAAAEELLAQALRRWPERRSGLPKALQHALDVALLEQNR